MTDASQDDGRKSQDESPTNEVLEEPSTEKEPGEEPKGGSEEDVADHEAVGIGVMHTSTPSEPGRADDDRAEQTGAEGAESTTNDSDDTNADLDLPTDAVTDDVRRASAELD